MMTQIKDTLLTAIESLPEHRLPELLNYLYLLLQYQERQQESIDEQNLEKFFQDAQNNVERLFKQLDPNSSNKDSDSINQKPYICAIMVPLDKSKEVVFYGTKTTINYHPWVKEYRFHFLDPGSKAHNIFQIKKSLNNRFQDSGFQIFIDMVWFKEQIIYIILQLPNKMLESYDDICLTKNTSFIRRTQPKLSLIHTTIYSIFIALISDLLHVENYLPNFLKSNHEILRLADFFLMDEITNIMKIPTLSFMEMANNVSITPYEGNQGSGEIVLCSQSHPNIQEQKVIWLKHPIPFNEHRAIRKLLETTTQNLQLLCDGSGVYGIGTFNYGNYDKQREDVFSVRFTKHATWKLHHVDHVLMEVNYGLPSLPKQKISRETFNTEFKKQFVDITEEELEHLWQLVSYATGQKHGTMLVVSNQAQEEANRLVSSSTLIDPELLDEGLILPLSAIDGAILIDKKGTCYAIGVILDGIAIPEKTGDPSRGARYNSAIRYKNGLGGDHACVIIVVSEDGMVNLI